MTGGADTIHGSVHYRVANVFYFNTSPRINLSLVKTSQGLGIIWGSWDWHNRGFTPGSKTLLSRDILFFVDRSSWFGAAMVRWRLWKSRLPRNCNPQLYARTGMHTNDYSQKRWVISFSALQFDQPLQTHFDLDFLFYCYGTGSWYVILNLDT